MAKQWLSSVFQVGALLFSKKYDKTKIFCCVQLQARKQHKHTTNNNGEIKTANKASISNIEAKSTKKGSKETDKSGA